MQLLEEPDPALRGDKPKEPDSPVRVIAVCLCPGTEMPLLRNNLSYSSLFIIFHSAPLALCGLTSVDGKQEAPVCLAVWFQWNFIHPDDLCRNRIRRQIHRKLGAQRPQLVLFRNGLRVCSRNHKGG